jgi:putative hydrolase of HD superfamily
MTDRPSVQRIAELQQFIADFASIERVPHLADKGRPENDAEHSFGLALTCWYLASHIAPQLDMARILKYALAHDTVEIHAGDTFFVDETGVSTKSDREDKAIEALKQSWDDDFAELADFAKMYKAKHDEEAKFVYAVDKLLPAIMVNLGEKSDFWKRHKITADKMAEKKKNILVSDIVAPYYDQLLEWMKDSNHFYDPASDDAYKK